MESPIWDELTLALDAHLLAHGRMLRAIATNADDIEATIQAATDTWRHFLVILTSRSTAMAAQAANGVVRSYTGQMSELTDRVEALERVVGQPLEPES